MNTFFKSISYIFHPLFMPFLGTLFYFIYAPKHIPEPILKSKIIALLLLTIVLPILVFFLLKSLEIVKSNTLNSTKERIIPLIINCVIIVLILKRVFPFNDFLELYFFFLGILLSTLSCLTLVLFNFKASIHLIAMSGILMFLIGFSIHFNKNINGILAIVFLITGAVASSRLHLKAHTSIELVIGFFIGCIPQLIFFNQWL